MVTYHTYARYQPDNNQSFPHSVFTLNRNGERRVILRVQKTPTREAHPVFICGGVLLRHYYYLPPPSSFVGRESILRKQSCWLRKKPCSAREKERETPEILCSICYHSIHLPCVLIFVGGSLRLFDSFGLKNSNNSDSNSNNTKKQQQQRHNYNCTTWLVTPTLPFPL